MANQGIDLGRRIGTYGNIYRNLAENRSWTKVLGDGWDKLFNEKTFASFMPQMYTQTFKDAFQGALKKGMSVVDAERFAGDSTKAAFGLFENGRSLQNGGRCSVCGLLRSEVPRGHHSDAVQRRPVCHDRNPQSGVLQEPALVAGMAVTYGLYNAVNKALNGNYMWRERGGQGV